MTFPIFTKYQIEEQIASIFETKALLKSGGAIVIDQTEALTVIDVNTGKFVGSKNLKDTIFKTNMEAAEEIARQLRLRAIGGIIVVDFIDMEQENDRMTVLKVLNEEIKKDKAKTAVMGFTKLGLVEITRKRARTDIRAALSHGCPFCGGLGWVPREESIALQIKRFIRKITMSSRSEALLIEAYSSIADYIAETFLASWEEEFDKKIFIRGCPEFSWGKFRLDAQGSQIQIEHRINSLQKREGWAIVHKSSSA